MKIICQALLFDMDGVLIDSTPAVSRVWRKWAIEHGLDPEEVVSKAHGRPSISTIRDYLTDADHEVENQLIEKAEIADLEGVVPLPGALTLLSSLPQNRWAIVTSSTRPLAEVRLHVAKLPVPSVCLTSSDVINGKPHPEPYLKAAARLRFAPEECMVFEDVPSGILAGKSAGSRVVAFRTTTDDASLKHAGADWIVDGCAQVRVTGTKQGVSLQLQD